ncbi:DnaJ domain-containing protein [Colletotrichum cereale]|nr:DnaJ domain-containing protein [Colletotrichum cereale]
MKQPSSVNHYVDLGIQQNATAPEIRQAYRELALKYHPDKKAPRESIDAEDFRKVQEAWEVLRDESKRVEYDQGYAEIHREWEDYRRWLKSQDPFEKRRRAREKETRRRAKATRAVRRQARSRRKETTARELQAAGQRLEQERVERAELADELEQCRRNMESVDLWEDEVDRVLKRIREDVAEMRERYEAGRADKE